MLCYTIIYYTILYYTILHYTILYYTILYYAILCYTIVFGTPNTVVVANDTKFAVLSVRFFNSVLA